MSTPTAVLEARTGVLEPYEIAANTFVVPEIVHAGPDAVVPLNSMIIRGEEPVIVDTGNFLSRGEWLNAAFSVVEPKDVRWIFLSHDDHDHIGNLDVALELCPKATLITTQFTVERVGRSIELPLERMRWVNSGETFSVGDRTLVALRPPVFDSPTTRGLFDTRTGVYWAVDTFASLAPGFVTDVDDCPNEMWEETLLLFNRMISPWHELLDDAKFQAYVDSVVRLGITTITGGHTPAIRGTRITEAFDLVRRISSLPSAELMGQADLDAILAKEI